MLRWYTILAVLSRGSISLGLLVAALFMSATEFGYVGIAFAAITSASQIFGYPGYLAALRSNVVTSTLPNRKVPLPLVLSVGAFVFVLLSFWAQLGAEFILLLVLTCFAAAASTSTQILNGLLQTLGFEKFAAKNTGAFVAAGVALGVPTSVFFGAEALIAAILFSYVLVSLAGFKFLRNTASPGAARNIEYRSFVYFSLSGLASSLFFIIAAKFLFTGGGGAEMGKLSFALQIRALIIFGAGIFGAEMLSRYARLVGAEGQIHSTIIGADIKKIVKIITFPILGIVGFCLFSDAEKLLPSFSRNVVLYMIGSGLLICLTVPFARAITTMYSEILNVALTTFTSAMCIGLLFLIPADARSFAVVFFANSALHLCASAASFYWVKGK